MITRIEVCEDSLLGSTMAENNLLVSEPRLRRHYDFSRNDQCYFNGMVYLHQSKDGAISRIMPHEGGVLKKFATLNTSLISGRCLENDAIHYVIRKEFINWITENPLVEGDPKTEWISRLELLDDDVAKKVESNFDNYFLIIRQMIFVPPMPDHTPQHPSPRHYEYHRPNETNYESGTKPFLMTFRFKRTHFRSGTHHQILALQHHQVLQNERTMLEANAFARLFLRGATMIYSGYDNAIINLVDQTTVHMRIVPPYS